MGIFDSKPKLDTPDVSSQLSELSQTVKTMQSSIQNLTQGMQTLYANQTQMSEAFGEFKGGLGQGNDHYFQSVATEEKFRSLSEYSPEELEAMNEQQKFAILEESNRKAMQTAIKEAIAPVDERIQNVTQVTAQEQSRAELDKVMNQKGPDGKLLRPDFNELTSTMVEMRKNEAYKNLPMKNLYVLAREEFKEKNPEGFAALEAKHFPKPENVHESYGGFLSATMQQTDEPGDMPLEDDGKSSSKRGSRGYRRPSWCGWTWRFAVLSIFQANMRN